MLHGVNKDKHGKVTVPECFALNFRVPRLYPQSFLLMVANKTRDITWKISPDPQNMMLKIGLVYEFTNERFG